MMVCVVVVCVVPIVSDTIIMVCVVVVCVSPIISPIIIMVRVVVVCVPPIRSTTIRGCLIHISDRTRARQTAYAVFFFIPILHDTFTHFLAPDPIYTIVSLRLLE